MKRFLEELKRRKVFRVAVVYGAVGFVVVQAASYVFPALLLPDVVFRVLVVLTLFGFPIALVLAWAFEVTPDGVRRTRAALRAGREGEPGPREDPGDHISAEVGPERSRGDAGAGPADRQFGYRHLLAVFAAGILVSLAVFGLSEPLSSGGSSEESGGVDRDRVVVVPFENRTSTDSLDPVGTMAADWITEGLSRTGVAQTVPTGTAMAAVREVRQESGGAVPPGAIAERTGSRLVVSGAVYRQGDSVHLQAEVADASSHRVTHSLGPVAAPTDAPMSAVEGIRQRVLGALATELDSLDVAAALQHDPPPYEAYRLYALGMAAFDDSEMEAAADYFRQAHDRDSTFVLPLAKAVAAYLNLDREAVADSLVARISAISEPQDLRPFTRAMLDYRRAQLSGTAIERYRTAQELAQLAPGSVWRYVVGRHALCLGRTDESVRLLAPIDTARDLSATARGSYLNHLARAHHLRGEFERELAILRALEYSSTVPSGEDAPPTLLYDSTVEADVHRLFDRIPGLAGLGRVERLREVTDRRLGLPPDVEPAPGDFYLTAARELEAHGSEEAAADFYGRSIEWYRDRPAEAKGTTSHLRGLGFVLYAAGRWEEALPVWRELVALREETGRDGSVRTAARNRGRLGMVAAALGDTATARRIDRWLASDSLVTADPFLTETGWTLYARAGIAAQLGEEDQAVFLLRRATRRGCWSYFLDRYEADPAFDPLSDHPGFLELVS